MCTCWDWDYCLPAPRTHLFRGLRVQGGLWSPFAVVLTHTMSVVSRIVADVRKIVHGSQVTTGLPGDVLNLIVPMTLRFSSVKFSY